MNDDHWIRLFNAADAVAKASLLIGCSIFAVPAFGVLDFVRDRDSILLTMKSVVGLQVAAIVVACGSLFVFHLRQAARR